MNKYINFKYSKIILIVIFLGIILTLWIIDANKNQNEYLNTVNNNQTTNQLSVNILNAIKEKKWDNLYILNCKSTDDNLEHSKVLSDFKNDLLKFNLSAVTVTNVTNDDITINDANSSDNRDKKIIKLNVSDKKIDFYTNKTKYKTMKCFNVNLKI